MTDTPERDLIEKARRVGNYHGIPIVLELADTIEALLSRVDKLEERVRELEDEIVDLWHESEAGRKELHECLGMTAEEYARWANPDALNKSAS